MSKSSSITKSGRLDKLILTNTAVSAGAKIGTALVSLFQIPIAYSYLGEREFGIWITLNSTIAFLGIADLGVGNTIQNEIADANAGNNLTVIRSEINRGVFLLTISASAVLALMLIAATLLPSQIFNLSEPDITRYRDAFVVSLACFSINLPLAIFQRACSGLQLTYIVSIWNLFANIIAYVGIIGVAKLNMGFTFFVIVAAMPPTFTSFGTAVTLFRMRIWSLADWKCSSLAILSDTLRRGIPFLFPQIGAMLINVGPPMIITALLGPEETSRYGILARLVGALGIIQQLVGASIWPAFTDANARADYVWIKRTYRRLQILNLVAVAAPQLLFVFWGGPALRLWAGGMQIDSRLLVLFGFYYAVLSVSQPPAVLLNSQGKVLGQAVFGLGAVLLMLIAMPTGLRQFGLAGAPLVGLVVFSSSALPLVWFEAERVLARWEISGSPRST